MHKPPRTLILSMALGVFSITGCNQAPTSVNNEQTEKLPVTVSITPQKYFLERIGGDNVSVNVMVQPGVDPHTYEPKPEQLRQLSQTKVYFSIGVSLEKAWMNRLQSANEKMLVVDTSQGVNKIPLVAHFPDHETEKHPHEEGEELDPHIWLSPKRVKIQAQTIYDTLVKIDPTNELEYKANLDSFLKDIDTLDKEIRRNLAPIKNRKFMVFHPEWGYFAQDYGLKMIAIEVQGSEPSATELTRLIQEAKKEGIKVVFAQPEFSAKSAEIIAKEIDGEVIFITALSPDWLNNLRQVSEKMSTLLVTLRPNHSYQATVKNKVFGYLYIV